MNESGEYFRCHTEEHAVLAATGCFFLGILLTILLQFLVDNLQSFDIACCTPPWSKKKAAKTEGEIKEQDAEDRVKKYSGVMKSLKSKLMGGRSDCDKKENIAGVPNIIATTEGKRSEKTKFDSTCAESEIVVMTDENSDEVGISLLLLFWRKGTIYTSRSILDRSVELPVKSSPVV